MTSNKLSHVAFILDGNKRWAKKNNYSKIDGYKKGFEKIKDLINFSLKIKLSTVRLFTLSSENINRNSVKIIFEIIYKNFSELIEQIALDKNIRIKIIGSKDKLPLKLINILSQAEEITKNNKDLVLNLAFNYGFKDEINNVLKKIKQNINDINIESDKEIRNFFYLGSTPDPEILIRTGGYKRLSNFIMYNLTYTELFFTDTLWPDFSEKEFIDIINKFSKIDRKYGL